tara:strand:- start:64 stop:552 length:489 start_codon:yes stop_codon:yes gene_type:complete
MLNYCGLKMENYKEECQLKYKIKKTNYKELVEPYEEYLKELKKEKIVFGKQYPRLKDTDKRGRLAFSELLKKFKLDKKLFNILEKDKTICFFRETETIWISKNSKIRFDLENYFMCFFAPKKKELTVDEKLNDLIKNLSNEELVNINIKINQLIITNIQLGV